MGEGVKLVPKRKLIGPDGGDVNVLISHILDNPDNIVPPVQGSWTINGAAPTLNFMETDQTDPAGRWRFRANGDILYLERAATADFATDTDFLTLYGTKQTDTPTFISTSHTWLNPTAGSAGSGSQTFSAQALLKGTSGAVTEAIKGGTAEAKLDPANTQNWTGSGATDIASLPMRAFQASLVCDTGATGTITAGAALLTTGVVRTGGCIVTNLYGLRVANIASAGTSSITNEYGIYIDAITGGATLNKALYIGGGGADIIQSDGASSLHLGTGTTVGSWLASSSDSGLSLAGGCQWNGSAWVARATAASIVNLGGGSIEFYANTGLSVGNTFTATIRASISATLADLGVKCEADAYSVGGVNGVDFTGAITSITVTKGIVTAAS